MADDKNLSLPTTVEGIATLGGCVLILIAFVNYDAAKGVNVRPSPSYGMLIAGAVLLGVALTAYRISRRRPEPAAEVPEAPKMPYVTVNVEQNAGPKAPPPREEPADDESDAATPRRRRQKSRRYPPGIDRARVDEISSIVNRLSGTQKDLMVFFYSLHRPHLPFEQAYEFLEKAQSGKVAGRDELYFRLKDLKSKDLIGLETQVRNVSFVRLLPDVAATLEALDLLPSGGD